MKLIIKKILAAFLIATIPMAAIAQVTYSGSTGSVSGASIVGTGGTTETLPTTTDTLAGLATSQTFTGTNGFGRINTQTQGFTATMPGNPLMLGTFQDLPVASVNAANGQIFVSGTTGRTIYPLQLSLMVSGTASVATSLKVVCSPSGKLVATFPIASLISSVPISPFSSGPGAIIAGPALVNGCISGDSLYVSNVGTNLAVTTDIYPALLYTVQ